MERLKRIWSAIKGEPRVVIHRVEINVQAGRDAAEIASQVSNIFRGLTRGAGAVS